MRQTADTKGGCGPAACSRVVGAGVGFGACCAASCRGGAWGVPRVLRAALGERRGRCAALRCAGVHGATVHAALRCVGPRRN